MDEQSDDVIVEVHQHWASIWDHRLWIHVFILTGSRVLAWNLHGNRLAGIPLPVPARTVTAILAALSLAAVLWLVLALVIRVLNWRFNTVTIDGEYLTYRLWPVAQDQIPLWAMQDISVRRTGFGLLCGYGTLAVRSGMTTEILTFLPHIDWIAAQLRGAAKRARAGQLVTPTSAPIRTA